MTGISGHLGFAVGSFRDRQVSAMDQMRGNVAVDVETDRARRRAATRWPIIGPAVSLASLPTLLLANNGPEDGYFWAVQRITVGPSGAATDNLTFYRGYSTADVQPQNAVGSATFTAAGQFTPVHIGKLGIILFGQQSLIIAGTITGTNPMLNWDAVQGELCRLHEFAD